MLWINETWHIELSQMKRVVYVYLHVDVSQIHLSEGRHRNSRTFFIINLFHALSSRESLISTLSYDEDDEDNVSCSLQYSFITAAPGGRQRNCSCWLVTADHCRMNINDEINLIWLFIGRLQVSTDWMYSNNRKYKLINNTNSSINQHLW